HRTSAVVNRLRGRWYWVTCRNGVQKLLEFTLGDGRRRQRLGSRPSAGPGRRPGARSTSGCSRERRCGLFGILFCLAGQEIVALILVWNCWSTGGRVGANGRSNGLLVSGGTIG